MPLSSNTITWARPRVQNFSEEYARKFIRALVSLEGATFDKAAFFGTLVAQGVVSDPTIPPAKTQQEIYAKRWDSYLAPIRPFGLGFVVSEQREQSPNLARKVWRASPIAVAFDRGEINYRDFIALQLARTQFPKVTMPLKDPAKSELQAGDAVQPLRLLVSVVDGLAAADESTYLTHDEICQLPRCHSHADIADAVAEIATHRAGGATPSWAKTEPADLDILVNDLHATRFFRRLTATSGNQPLVVPSYPRFRAAGELVAAIDWIDVLTSAGIEAYYERLMSVPTDDVVAILALRDQVLRVDANEVVLEGSTVKGPSHIVAGLDSGDEVFVSDAARMTRVVTPAATSALAGGVWQSTIGVERTAFVP